MSKKKKIIIIIAAAAVLLTAGGVAYAFKEVFLKKVSPEAYMAAVFLNTVNAFDREILKLPDMYDTTNSPFELILTVGLKDYAGVPPTAALETLKLLTFTMDYKVDKQKRKMSSATGVSLGGASVVDFDIFLSDDTYAASCAALTDKTVTINPKTFVKDWNTSDFFNNLTTLPEDAADSDNINNFIFSDNNVFKNIDPAVTERLKNETVSFITSPLRIDLGDIRGTVFVMYGKDELNALYKSYADVLVSLIEDRLSYFTELTAGYGMTDDYTKAIIELIDGIKSVEFTNDVSIELIIDDNDLIRSISFPGAEQHITITLGNGEGLLSDYIVIQQSGDFKLTIDLTGSTADKLQQTLTLDVTHWAKIIYTASYSPADDGAFNLSFSYAQNNDTALVSIKGDMTADTDFVQLKNGVLKAAYNDYSIELKTDYALKAYEGDIMFNDAKAVSFFDMSVIDLGLIALKAQELLSSF